MKVKFYVRLIALHCCAAALGKVPKTFLRNPSVKGYPPTVHWIQDNFVFGQNSKSLLVFRNGPVRSFGTFYATFEKQNGDFFIPSVKKVDLKNRKNEKMAQNG